MTPRTGASQHGLIRSADDHLWRQPMNRSQNAGARGLRDTLAPSHSSAAAWSWLDEQEQEKPVLKRKKPFKYR